MAMTLKERPVIMIGAERSGTTLVMAMLGCHPRIAVLDVALTADDFPVGVTGKVLKRELRDRYSDLANSVAVSAPLNRAVAAFMTDRPDSAVG